MRTRYSCVYTNIYQRTKDRYLVHMIPPTTLWCEKMQRSMYVFMEFFIVCMYWCAWVRCMNVCVHGHVCVKLEWASERESKPTRTQMENCHSGFISVHQQFWNFRSRQEGHYDDKFCVFIAFEKKACCYDLNPQTQSSENQGSFGALEFHWVHNELLLRLGPSNQVPCFLRHTQTRSTDRHDLRWPWPTTDWHCSATWKKISSNMKFSFSKVKRLPTTAFHSLKSWDIDALIKFVSDV